MTNAASTSNPSVTVNVNEAYPNPSHAIGPNFFTMKLSGKDTYSVWETQILSLLWSQHMVGFIEDQFPSPAGNEKGKVGDIVAWIASDSLVKGWILGSLSDGVAKKVVNRLKTLHKNTYFTAKDLWDQLQRSYGPSNCKQAADSLVKGWILGSLSKEDRKAVNHLIHMEKDPDFTAKDLWDELQRSYGPSVREQAVETKSSDWNDSSPEGDFTTWNLISPTRQAESEIEVISESEDAKSKEEPTEEKTEEEKRAEILQKIFSGEGLHYFDDTIKEMNKVWLYEDIIKGKTKDAIFKLEDVSINPWDKLANNGNTVLHVAVGSSTKNHELLAKLLEMTPTENTLIDVVNSDGSTLLHVAAIGGNINAVNMLVKRNPELLLATDNEGHIPLALSVSNMLISTSECLFEHMKAEGYDSYFSGPSGEEIVVLAISFQDFRLAKKIINDYPDAILSDAVLTTLAQNFPREPNFWERGREEDYNRILNSFTPIIQSLDNYFDWPCGRQLFGIFIIFFIVLCKVATMFCGFLKVLVHLFFADTFQIHEDATKLLYDVCNKIFFRANSSTYHHYYTTLTFEATSRNASTFIRYIMRQFPEAIWIENEDGHNFIQYSVISRSEKIYNLIYEMSEHKYIYKTIKDSSGNNLLHLAARLAPASKLSLISGPALQIQRELQWFKEVEGFVSPLNKIQRNSDDETPEMVFTREHKDLVIEGQNWIKRTAESYTITAALIITVVFAAAITVPGGNIQDSGIPIFAKNIAFTVFAISIAISLFTAVTSLLMFLSILTSRLAEQDFLFQLPKKLIIGLTMLFLSTTTMVIAFGATLFLVFGQRNLLMLIPIGALTCLPITSFVTLQCPLIIELIRATYGGGIFVREEYDYFYINHGNIVTYYSHC